MLLKPCIFMKNGITSQWDYLKAGNRTLTIFKSDVAVGVKLKNYFPIPVHFQVYEHIPQ